MWYKLGLVSWPFTGYGVGVILNNTSTLAFDRSVYDGLGQKSGVLR